MIYQKRQKGLTLLELLVSLAIVAMIGLATAYTLRNSIVSEARITERAEGLQMLDYALSVLRLDLEQAIARPFKDELGKGSSQPLIGYHDEVPGRAHLLSFVKTGRRTLPASIHVSRLEHVSYYFSDNKLFRSSSTVPTPLDDSQNTKRVLLSGLKSVRFYYYDSGWNEEWSVYKVQAHLPKAVRVVLDTEMWGEVSQVILLPETSDA